MAECLDRLVKLVGDVGGAWAEVGWSARQPSSVGHRVVVVVVVVVV